MTARRFPSVPALVLAACGIAAIGWGADILGTKPGYLTENPDSVPNQQAVTRMIWAPGLDDGYVPQGVAVTGAAVLLSGYRSTDPTVGTGPCRLFRIDPATGAATGTFDLPSSCGHAGGLAYLGHDSLVVADTRRLYRVDLSKAFDARTAGEAVTATVSLAGAVKGSFADFDGTDLWLGVYDRNEDRSKVFRFPPSVLDELNGTGRLTEARALAALAVPIEAQGAAFDREGSLWITSSSSRFGALHKLDPKTGAARGSWEMVIGIEDIGFDVEGRLWAVSEAGSQRWRWWARSFPIVFQLDVSRLR